MTYLNIYIPVKKNKKIKKNTNYLNMTHLLNSMKAHISVKLRPDIYQDLIISKPIGWTKSAWCEKLLQDSIIRLKIAHRTNAVSVNVSRDLNKYALESPMGVTI
jgi:hypothetical protein